MNLRPVDKQNIFVLAFLAFIGLCWLMGWVPR
jgi:hypothetical protein